MQNNRLYRPVHPRMCGEHAAVAASSNTNIGSSPHVRGTHKTPQFSVAPDRFIPACAGNTVVFLINLGEFSVHPRMCGEHLVSELVIDFRDGSSPHVRGTPIFHFGICGSSRFIPACAGNTPTRERGGAPPTVHPRMCGEHYMSGDYWFVHHGSSPHVRGTL